LRVARDARRSRGDEGDDQRRRLDALWHCARLDDRAGVSRSEQSALFSATWLRADIWHSRCKT